MGNTGSGLSRSGSQGGLDDEDDVNDLEAFQSSEILVPDESKPRGRIGQRASNSHTKKSERWKTISSSLQSALSTDMENPEAERIRREFELYRKNKENEITNIQKNEKRSTAENKRLRAELQALQRTCNRLRSEREAALQAEHQAMARATTFETDRDKVQRQFKIFRETKEKEIQDLLRAKRDLESKLSKVAPDMLPDDSNKQLTTETNNNPGDWWTQLESDPSSGSNTQIHQTIGRSHELTSSLLQLEMAQGLNRDIWQYSSECANSAALQLYVTHTADMQHELDQFMENVVPQLRQMIEGEGHFLNLVNFPLDSNTENVDEEKLLSLRRQYAEQSTIILGFIGDVANSFVCSDVHYGHLKSPGDRPAHFCIKSLRGSNVELSNMKMEIKRTGEAKLYDDCTNTESLMSQLTSELKTNFLTVITKLRKLMELGVEAEKTESGQESAPDSGVVDVENDSCGCTIWDEHSHLEHLEAFYAAAKCANECALEKSFEKLNNHITTPGLSPPFLVTGSPGCGKSLLLAKWIQKYQLKGSPGIILYHFVGCKYSVSTDPIHMIRRLTSQLMQHAVNPPVLTCDPSRLMEEFPRWLEKVSTKTPGGVIVVIDGLDKFQQGETHLRWLLDPLPVDSRVIVSVNEEACTPVWRQWTSLKIEPLTSKNVKELLRGELQQKGCYLDSESEAKILTHCRTPQTCCPLYITVLASCLASINDERKLQHQLDQCLAADDSIELYLIVLDYMREKIETADSTKGCIKKVLKLIYSSRNGLGDWECLDLVPGITWNFWALLTQTLLSFKIIVYRAGLMCLAHDQIRAAIELKYFPRGDEGKQLALCRTALVEYFGKAMVPGQVTCRIADEVPWLYQQLGDKEGVKKSLLCLCVFLSLYVRGRCNEIITYWQYIGIDKNQMAELYISTTQKYEQMVDKSSLVTLPKISDLYEAQGKFLRDLGMLKEACNPLQRSLELRETTLDPDHPRVAMSLHLLASVHAQWNKYPAAESLYKQALDIYQNAYGADHIMVAKELDALVVLYQKQNKHDVAEPLKKQANLIRKKNRVPQINTDESENIRSSSFKANKRNGKQLEGLTMGPDSPDLATKLNELGVLYYVQGNHSTAETFFKRALRMRQQLLPSDHPDVGQSCKNLAALYYDQKELEKAEPLYEKALQIKLKFYGPESKQVVSVIKNLAPVYKKLQKWQKAAPLYKQIVELREKAAGDKSDPSLATSLVNLAVIYCHMSQQSDAEPLYERALKIYESSLGLTHPRVAETLHNVAVLKYEQGDYEAAAKLYKRATDIKSSTYGKEKTTASRASSVNSIPLSSGAVKTQKIFIEALESHS